MPIRRTPRGIGFPLSGHRIELPHQEKVRPEVLPRVVSAESLRSQSGLSMMSFATTHRSFGGVRVVRCSTPTIRGARLALGGANGYLVRIKKKNGLR